MGGGGEKETEELTKYSSRASNRFRFRSSPSSCSRLIWIEYKEVNKKTQQQRKEKRRESWEESSPVPYLGYLLAVQIVARLCERLQTEGCTDHDEKKGNAKQRGISL